jgi:biotin-(acetyl-CoA carboxylase) ligase
VSTPDEPYRATLPVLTPDGEPASIIVTRQGRGSQARVWVTFSGAWVTTAVMTDDEAEQLVQLVGEARRGRRENE